MSFASITVIWPETLDATVAMLFPEESKDVAREYYVPIDAEIEPILRKVAADPNFVERSISREDAVALQNLIRTHCIDINRDTFPIKRPVSVAIKVPISCLSVNARVAVPPKDAGFHVQVQWPGAEYLASHVIPLTPTTDRLVEHTGLLDRNVDMHAFEADPSRINAALTLAFRFCTTQTLVPHDLVIKHPMLCTAIDVAKLQMLRNIHARRAAGDFHAEMEYSLYQGARGASEHLRSLATPAVRKQIQETSLGIILREPAELVRIPSAADRVPPVQLGTRYLIDDESHPQLAMFGVKLEPGITADMFREAMIEQWGKPWFANTCFQVGPNPKRFYVYIRFVGLAEVIEQ